MGDRESKRRKTGNLYGLDGRRQRSPGNPSLEYILSRTTRNGDCVEWTGARMQSGYGQISYDGKTDIVTRVVMALLGHDIEGKTVMHACDNPPCINPKHLVLGTNKDNVDDRQRKGRTKTGKTFGEENVHAVLTASDVHEMRMARLMGARPSQFKKLYGVSKGTVDALLGGTAWVSVDGDARENIKRLRSRHAVQP